MDSFALAKLGWRNIWRNRRRTAITLSGITFGMMMAILFTGLGDSMYGGMIDQAARLGSGHVTLQHEQHMTSPSAKRFLTETSALRTKVMAHLGVLAANPRIAGELMLAAGGESRGASFIGIDPRLETTETLSPVGAITAGKMFAHDDKRGVVLGATLARNLGVKVGRKVVYTLTDKTGEIVNGLLRVRGIVTTGADELDAALCLVPLDLARKALRYGHHDATLLAVLISDQREAALVAGQLRASLPVSVAAVTWEESMPDLANLIAVDVSSIRFLQALVIILVAAGIFNTLFVSVMERSREFGVLVALGWQPAQLFALVMWESLWLAIVGVLAAAMATAGPYWWMNTRGVDISDQLGGASVAGVIIDPILRVDIYPENVVIIVLIVGFATVASGLLPAWRAGRVEPVDAIKLV